MALVLHIPKQLNKRRLFWAFLWVQFPPWAQNWVCHFQPCALQIAADYCNLGQCSSGSHYHKGRGGNIANMRRGRNTIDVSSIG